MTLLGIDTSTSASSACVLRADGEAFEEGPTAERLLDAPAHSSELMPAVAGAMARAGVGWSDLTAIAVGVGPGAFTGLRIGIATARALAVGGELGLRRVSSLAALAAGIPASLRLPLIDARRGEVFAALFEENDEIWAPFAASPEELVARLREGGFSPVAAGDGSLRFRGMLEQAGIQVESGESAAHTVRALHVCRLAAGAPDMPPEAVLPEYLREPDAKPQQ